MRKQFPNKLQGLIGGLISIFVFQFASAQNNLFIPPLWSGKNFNLQVQNGTATWVAGQTTPTYGVNGNFLAPTLELWKGDNVSLTVHNGINAPTTMHWHGMHLPSMADGGPHSIIYPGQNWTASFKVMNPAATCWYHPHGAHTTDLQVSKGLAGMIIVRDSQELALQLPRTYGVDDFPIIIQTKAFDVLYQTAISTELDTLVMVNGTPRATLNIPAQIVRLRLLNGSSNRSFFMGLSNGDSITVIGTDNGLLNKPYKCARLMLSNGERAEVLINANNLLGQNVQLICFGSEMPHGIKGADSIGNGAAMIMDYNLNPLNGADYNLLTLHVTNSTATPILSIPNSLANDVPFSINQVDRTRKIVFTPSDSLPATLVMGPFHINDTSYNEMHINDTVYLNSTEQWSIVNLTLIAHPFHLHDMHFYVHSINNSTIIPVQDQGRKDVVLVMPGDSLTFITKFEDFADDMVPYMYHCHLLHHEDDGMMGSFLVLDTTTHIGMNDIKVTNAYTLFPNPCSNVLSFDKALTPHNSIRCWDVLGCEMPIEFINETSLNTSNYNDGIYVLQIDKQHFKFIKTH
jgi:bilirubin oxidase